MHHKSWSNLRRIMEEDRLCPALRGRVQYFLTRYHDAHDEYGRFCIRVDGKEHVCSCFGDWYDNKAAQQSLGKYPVWRVVSAVEAYMDELTIDEALSSESPLIRLFAVLDRRVGKRRLPELAAAMENEPEWLQFFYRLRLGEEGFGLKEANDHV